MLRKYMILFIVLATVLTLSACGPKEVTFPDLELEAVIRDAIDKPEGSILASDLEGLTSLFDLSKSITDLTGLEYCTDLTRLHLGDRCQISDLSPVASLANLRSLHLYRCEITDISPIASLTSLTMLSLDMNQISDISPLASLTNLRFLSLDGCEITDVSPLASLTSLTMLSLDMNQITDISPIASLTSLTDLQLGWNQISDISPLASLTNLRFLSLWGNEISDIEPLVANRGLSAGDTVVVVFRNPLSSTSVSEYVPQLVERGVKIDHEILD